MKIIQYKNQHMLTVEEREKENVEEILRRKYVDESKSKAVIAKELLISYATVYRWLQLAGIYSHRLHIERREDIVRGSNKTIR